MPKGLWDLGLWPLRNGAFGYLDFGYLSILIFVFVHLGLWACRVLQNNKMTNVTFQINLLTPSQTPRYNYDL
jgi:hypothetical protein